MSVRALLLGSVLLLGISAACGRGGPPAREAVAASADSTRVSAAAAELAITADGIGLATRGLTLSRLRALLPPGVRIGALQDFMVDVEALPVIAGTDTLYYLLFPAGTEPAAGAEARQPSGLPDAQPLQLVATVASGARTAEGIGPGVTLAEAARVCGGMVLSYSVNDESREYVQCAAMPATIRLRVRPGSGERAFAGNYPGEAEYNTTVSYDPTARIWMVIVDLTPREQYAPPALDSVAVGGD